MSSIHTWRMRANKLSHSHWCWRNILWRLFDYRHLGKHYRMQTKAFTITHLLLPYHPYIPILDKWICSFAVRLVYVYAALNNAENIPLSKNIIGVCVSFTRVLPASIRRYSRPTDSNNTSYISYTIQCRELVPRTFDSFWTTLHEYVHMGPSNRTVLLCGHAWNLWGTLCIMVGDNTSAILKIFHPYKP